MLDLGRRDVGVQRLREAEQVMLRAIPLISREVGPQSWAATHNQLALCRLELGRRSGTIWPLRQALTAFSLAQQVWTREANLLGWISVQANRAELWAAMCEVRGKPLLLRLAIARIREALGAADADTPLQTVAKLNLSLAARLCQAAKADYCVGLVSEGLTALDNADRLLADSPNTTLWAKIHLDRGVLLSIRGVMEDNAADLADAVSAIEYAAGVFTLEEAPGYRRVTLINLATALVGLANLTDSCAASERANQALHEAVSLDPAAPGRAASVIAELHGVAARLGCKIENLVPLVEDPLA
jgi:hypothetical protein